jgi:hypothetical protein
VTLAELAARPTAYLGKPIETVGIPSYAHDLMFLYDGGDFVFVRWDVPNIRHCLRKRVIANGVVEKGVARNRHGFQLHVTALRDSDDPAFSDDAPPAVSPDGGAG